MRWHIIIEDSCRHQRKIRVDTSGFLMGVIMAECYGTTTWFKAMVHAIGKSLGVFYLVQNDGYLAWVT